MQRKLLDLKKYLESALRIVETEIRMTEPVEAGCDSRGFIKPPCPCTRFNAVETIVWDNWDSVIPDGPFTAAKLKANFKTGNISRRSHASFSTLLSRWATSRYLNVEPGEGPNPNTYSKKSKLPIVPEVKGTK